MNLFARLLLSTLLCVPLAACSQPAAPTSAASKPAAAPAAPLVQSNSAGLPDFTVLVEKEGPAVVNISTTQTVRDRGGLSPFPNMPEDDPFSEFLKRFMPQQPQGGAPREYQTHSLGSGFIIAKMAMC